MWIFVIVALVLLLVGVLMIYQFLKNMGEDGIEAAAPGSCRSGRCGVTPPEPPATPVASIPLEALSRRPELEPEQPR